MERYLLLGHGHKLPVIVVEGIVNNNIQNAAPANCLLLALSVNTPPGLQQPDI
jgi:hypothetical protein